MSGMVCAGYRLEHGICFSYFDFTASRRDAWHFRVIPDVSSRLLVIKGQRFPLYDKQFGPASVLLHSCYAPCGHGRFFFLLRAIHFPL